ncbi:hypothetical protein CBL_03777 [Carabus blaptoides fortunei]
MARNDKKRAEVIENLKTVWPNFDLHTDDLYKPTPASVCKFFEKLFEELAVDIDKITMRLSQCLSSPDAYQDILHFYVIYRCARVFLERLKIEPLAEPVKITDILQPRAMCTRIRVLMIANFLLYAHNLITETLQPIENAVKDGLVAIVAMHKELDELGTKTNTLALEYTELEKEQDKIQKEIDESMQEYVKHTDMHNKILEENENRKKESNKLEAERTRLMEILRKEEAKGNELKELLVEDADVIVVERERLERELTEQKSYETDYALNLDTKNDSEQKYLAVTAIVDEFLEQEPLEHILDLYKIQETMKTSLEKMKEELQGLHTFQTDFHSNSQKMQEETDSLQEELQAMQVQLDAKQSVMQQEIQLLEAEHKELASKHTRNERWAEKVQRKIQHAIACCAQHERNMQALNEFHQREYKKILQNTSALHNKVDHNLKETKINSEQVKLPLPSTEVTN